MKTFKVPAFRLALLLVALFTLAAAAVQTQTTAFTYQGRLADNGNSSPTRSYNLQFTLLDAGGASSSGSKNSSTN